MWRDVMRAAFEDVGTFEFAATDPAAMGALLSPLAALTSHPPLLRLLACGGRHLSKEHFSTSPCFATKP